MTSLVSAVNIKAVLKEKMDTAEIHKTTMGT